MMLPEHREFIDLYTLNEFLDEHRKFSHEVDDLFQYHLTNGGLSFYFSMKAIKQGGELFTWCSEMPFKQVFGEQELIEYKPNPKNTLLAFSYKNGQKENKVRWHDGKVATSYTYEPIKILYTREKLADSEYDVWIEFPNPIEILIDKKKHLLLGTSFEVHTRGIRLTNVGKVLKVDNRKPKTARRPLEVSCKNIFVKTQELKLYLEVLDKERIKNTKIKLKVKSGNSKLKTDKRGEALLKILEIKKGGYWEVGNGEQREIYIQLKDEYRELFVNKKDLFYSFKYFQTKILPKIRDKGYYEK